MVRSNENVYMKDGEVLIKPKLILEIELKKEYNSKVYKSFCYGQHILLCIGPQILLVCVSRFFTIPLKLNFASYNRNTHTHTQMETEEKKSSVHVL